MQFLPRRVSWVCWHFQQRLTNRGSFRAAVAACSHRMSPGRRRTAWAASPHRPRRGPCGRCRLMSASISFCTRPPWLKSDAQQMVSARGEGADVWPPPNGFVDDPVSSPLSTPPLSPDASLVDLPAACSSIPLASPTTRPNRPPAPAAAIAPGSPQEIPPATLRQRAGKKARQARKRQEQKRDPLWTRMTPALSRLWGEPGAYGMDFSVAELPATAGAFTGTRKRRRPGDRATPWTLPELAELGFKLIEWDGRHAPPHRPSCPC